MGQLPVRLSTWFPQHSEGSTRSGHQSPGFHHTRYREEFEKKVKQGKYDIVFQDVNIFELAFTGIFRNYERLAGMVKDPKPDCAEVLKRRLRETIW